MGLPIVPAEGESGGLEHYGTLRCPNRLLGLPQLFGRIPKGAFPLRTTYLRARPGKIGQGRGLAGSLGECQGEEGQKEKRPAALPPSGGAAGCLGDGSAAGYAAR